MNVPLLAQEEMRKCWEDLYFFAAVPFVEHRWLFMSIQT